MRKAAVVVPPAFRILNESTETVPVDSLRPHPRNVNESPSAMIAESLRENGFYGSLVVQKSTRYILVGRHRWREAQTAGATEIPVTFVDVDDERALRIMLADNRTARLGTDNPDELTALLQELNGLTGTGYTPADLDDLLGESAAMVFAAEEAETKNADKLAAAAAKAHNSKKNAGTPKSQIKPVIYAEQVKTFEKALKLAKEPNRGKALMKVCEFFIDEMEAQLV
jgi:ParB-like chromosome segregation protein Spo0J